MSESDFTKINCGEPLFHEADSTVEDDPAPTLPGGSSCLVTKVKGLRFEDVQLVPRTNDPPLDPALSLSDISSQPFDWAQEMEEWREGKLLEFEGEEASRFSDSKEEQQDMGVPKHSPSKGETFLEGSQEKGEQKGNPLQPEPSDPEIVGGARRRVSPQASQANSGQGSRPLPPHIKWWLSVCSPRLRGRYQPEQKAIESEEPSAPSLFCPQSR